MFIELAALACLINENIKEKWRDQFRESSSSPVQQNKK